MTINIGGDDVTEITIDGDTVTEVTADGDVVWTASTATVVDSYERASLDHYDGSTANYSITSNFASDGSNCVEFTGDTSRQNTVSTSGLSNYPSKGSEIQVDVQTSNGSSASSTHELSVLFGAVDIDNFYMAQLRPDSPYVQLWEYSSGFTSIATSSPLSEWSADTTYRVRIRWDDGSTFGGSDGDISVGVFNPSDTNIGGVSATDTTHNGSGIGFSSILPSTGDYNRWDYWRITN